jgi:acetyl-CoA carboxylase biotin carboxyl carrier protein
MRNKRSHVAPRSTPDEPQLLGAEPKRGAPGAGVVTGRGFDLRLIGELARLVSEHQLSELALTRDGEKLRLRRGSEHVTSVVATVPASPPVAAAGAAHLAPAAPAEETGVSYITSPFVGTFYRAPNPDAPPYTDVGARIRKGQVLCIVEAMKLMNEIESEVDGTVLEILGVNGQPVEYGQQLFKVKLG